ncbi:MAG: YbgC/FadM family acyl-CoA thioesterase [Proteobacteria bacterium]|jgi:acyl-CoA thioester hydrolase|nr:YbgC/FadM family acyl-CoA thioesterase [Pseudomonadota bacterium]MDA1239109.1 YbgC/FadM family acyl-CoA thioesterase [Pseudomonadota bacterium]
MSLEEHQFSCRVYHEDTDFGGIVYYANYLKFIERARSEWIRSLGIDQLTLKDDYGMIFVVSRVEADFLLSAKYDDILSIRTRVQKLTPIRIALNQEIFCQTKLLFRSVVSIVPIGSKGSVLRLPEDIRKLMGG